jgi:hypothetical protein
MKKPAKSAASLGASGEAETIRFTIPAGSGKKF